MSGMDPVAFLRAAGFLEVVQGTGLLGQMQRFYFPDLHEVTDRRMREGWVWPEGVSSLPGDPKP